MIRGSFSGTIVVALVCLVRTSAQATDQQSLRADTVNPVFTPANLTLEPAGASGQVTVEFDGTAALIDAVHKTVFFRITEDDGIVGKRQPGDCDDRLLFVALTNCPLAKDANFKATVVFKLKCDADHRVKGDTVSSFVVQDPNTMVDLCPQGVVWSKPMHYSREVEHEVVLEDVSPDAVDMHYPNKLSVTCTGTPEASANGNVLNFEECDETDIPTTSEWGVAVMTLLVLTAATIVLLRRRSSQAV